MYGPCTSSFAPILSDFLVFLPLRGPSLCPGPFPIKRRPENPALNLSSGLLPMSKFLEFCAFSRLIPFMAAANSSNRALASAPPANLASSISIFTPATLPAPVGQMLSK